MFRHAISLLACAFALQAHEIGTSRVSVLFHEGRTYDIEIATDATALNEKLARVDGAGFEDKFPARVKIMFDGAEVHPAMKHWIEPAVDAASVPAAIIHLTGDIPRGAKTFSWSFGWTFASYALMIRSAPNDNPATQWLEGGDPSRPFVLAAPPPPVNRWLTALRYLRLGFTHIVPEGFDHVLFVLGIFLLSRNPRSVLMQVSAFTVAHSITLGLSMYGLVSVPSRVVEPMIAISIAYVAIENIFLAELKSWRVALVFCFGLLHGLGFAGALKELGLPRSEFLTALLTFNVGVEAGQLAVIATAFLLVGWHSGREWYRSRIVVPASALIACMAVYWTIQRL